MKKMATKDRLLAAAYAVLYWLGVSAIFYAIRRKRVIVSYHNVIPDEIWDDRLHLGVSHRLSEFEAQIQIICRRFNVGTDFSDRRQCQITFDDGNQNNLIAASILEKHGVRGVFFVPVQAALSGQLCVIERVLMWFSYVPAGTYRLTGRYQQIDERTRSSAYTRFYEWLLGSPARWDDAVKELNDAYPFLSLRVPEGLIEQRFTPLRAAQLEQMKERGHRIGCHSWRHIPLSILSDDALAKEFEPCAQLQFNSPAYCYPFGGRAEVDGRVIGACKTAGFKFGLLNVPHNSFDAGDFALNRLSLPQTANRYVIEAKLSGLEMLIKRLWIKRSPRAPKEN